MDYNTAIEALNRGARITRRPCWSVGTYAYRTTAGHVWWRVIEDSTTRCEPWYATTYDMAATDWAIVETPGQETALDKPTEISDVDSGVDTTNNVTAGKFLAIVLCAGIVLAGVTYAKNYPEVFSNLKAWAHSVDLSRLKFHQHDKKESDDAR